MKWLVVALLIVVLAAPNASNAWGPRGHAIVVRLAFKLMTDEQRSAAVALLGTDNPDLIGNWADKVRHLQHEKDPWHYVDIPARRASYKESRDCLQPCLISQLKWSQSVVCDRNYSAPQRKEALLWWFHLVGDLYQPFHCYDRNRGGNLVRVRYHNRWTSLHKLWDSHIINFKHLADSMIDSMFSRFPKPESIPSFEDAANVSHELAIEAVLGKGETADYAYVRKWWPVMLRRLWQAAYMASNIKCAP